MYQRSISYIMLFYLFYLSGSRWCMVRWSPHWYHYREYKANYKSDLLFCQNNPLNRKQTRRKSEHSKVIATFVKPKSSLRTCTWFHCMRLIQRENSLIFVFLTQITSESNKNNNTNQIVNITKSLAGPGGAHPAPPPP